MLRPSSIALIECQTLQDFLFSGLMGLFSAQGTLGYFRKVTIAKAVVVVLTTLGL